MANLQELKNKHKEMGEEIARLQASMEAERKGPWSPKQGETFFVVTEAGYVERYWMDENNSKDVAIVAQGNAFKTFKEASDESRRRGIKHKLRSLTKGFVYNKDNPREVRFYLSSHHNGYTKRFIGITVEQEAFGVNNHSRTYFRTREDAEEALEIIGVKDFAFLCPIS